MASCEICGRKGELYRAIVEDVELSVCQSCSSLGRVIGRAEPQQTVPSKMDIQKRANAEQEFELIVDNFAELIKRSRESMDITQKEFAQRINEKESVVHNIETAHIRPSILLARKLEKLLKIKLVESYKESKETGKGAKHEGMTIGDIINIKQKYRW